MVENVLIYLGKSQSVFDIIFLTSVCTSLKKALVQHSKIGRALTHVPSVSVAGQPDSTGSRHPERYLVATTRISNFRVILEQEKISPWRFSFFHFRCI